MSDQKGFMIVTCKIDPSQNEAFKHYVSHARPIFGAHGGRPLGQYAVVETETGSRQTTHVIVMEFPSTDAVRAVFKDAAYLELVPSRTVAFPILDILIAEAFNPAAMMAG